MRLAGRVAAAIEVLTAVLTRHQPASEALRDWGKAHRFAGSSDRHAIGTLVYDCLRRRQSAAALMGAETPRALVLGTLRLVWGLNPQEIASLAVEQHGPGELKPQELAALENNHQPAEDYITGDYPAWLSPSFARVFGAEAGREGAALAARAPIDLRANSLKTDQAELLKLLAKFGAVAGPLSPLSVRIPAGDIVARHINVEAEPAHGQGLFEVQDSASQLAALFSGVKPNERVLDLCAGAGGKSLALAAAMQNEGELVAYDQDKHRLRPIFERIQRAGVKNITVVGADESQRLNDMGGFDCVVIDAPCTGSGSWRRKPDAKWRLTDRQLAQRQKDQRAVLARGASLVKPGGRLIYITCSVLPEENSDQVAEFCRDNPDFSLIPFAQQWERVIGGEAPVSADGAQDGLLLTPRRHGTDGFFMAALERKN